MNGLRSGNAISEGLLLYTGALLLSILAGVFVANSEFVWVIAAVGVLVAASLVSSRQATFYFVIVTGLVVVGVSQMYLPGAKYLKYIPPLAAGGLLLHVIAEVLMRPPKEVPRTVPLFLAFLLVGLISLAMNWSSAGMAVIGLKAYYPMWGVFLGLALISWQPKFIDSIPKAAVVLAVVQLPFVAHQFLFLVPMRQGMSDVVAVDIVAGTFGGIIHGGGANAVLTVFMITVCACLLGLWRQKAISGTAALGGVLLFLAPVFLNSSRVALIYLPIVYGVVFSTQVIRYPLRAFVGLMLTAGLVAGMLMTFTALSQGRGAHTWQDLVITTYENQLASEHSRTDNYSGLSRWTVLTFWAEEHQNADAVKILLGHGPGATRVQEEGIDLAETLAMRRYGGLQIGYTAVAALLWEVGVVGLLLMLLMFWIGFRQAGALARFYDTRDPWRAGIAHGLRASMVVLVLSLAHKDFLVFHIPYQTFLACVLGYLAAEVNLMRRSGPERERYQTLITSRANE